MTMQRVLAAVNFPLLLGLAAVAPVFVPSVLGEQWAPTIILVQILAGVAIAVNAIATAGVDLGFLMEATILSGLGLSIWKRV